MPVIKQFIETYRREFDFYEQAARLAHGILDSALSSSGIQAIVTYRAKRPDRLEQKLRHRNNEKQYTCLQDIYSDIVDLAGVRIALYFPGTRLEVEKIIRSNFNFLEEPKSFPKDPSNKNSPNQNSDYKKRFSGYWATHYRLRIKDQLLQESQKRYADALIEIQVASVLMHAWSEVEHDLVYKPFQGTLSDDEYAILDELNGLVLAGEIALERLQKAMAVRVNDDGIPFASHYELASFLLRCAAPILRADTHESLLGRVDMLFDFLVRVNKNTPEDVRPLVNNIQQDVEERPVSDQIIDQLMVEQPGRYEVFEDVRHRYEHNSSHVMGEFIQSWIELEQYLNNLIEEEGIDSKTTLRIRSRLEEYIGIEPDTRRELSRLRMIRNRVVHGLYDPDEIDLKGATESVKRILQILQERN